MNRLLYRTNLFSTSINTLFALRRLNSSVVNDPGSPRPRPDLDHGSPRPRPDPDPTSTKSRPRPHKKKEIENKEKKAFFFNFIERIQKIIEMEKWNYRKFNENL